MSTEYEVRILEIDVEKIVLKLNSIGAKKIITRNMKRYVYDFIPKKNNSWIRLRYDGEKATLAIKEIQNENIDGTKETEVLVNDFDTTNIILNKLGYSPKGYQENKRMSYVLDGVEIEIDYWPKIPAYLEIEGKSVEEVEKMVKKLGFEMSDTTTLDPKKIYEKYGISLEEIKELRF